MQSLARFVLPVGVDISDLNQTAPQYRALQWLAHDIPRRTIEDNSTELLECFSLVTLYYATRGENWSDGFLKSNWLSDGSYCNWIGISCNWNGRVFEFHLRGVSGGTLPPEIGKSARTRELCHFRQYLFGEHSNNSHTFKFQGNTFSGTLPSAIGNLQQLLSLRIQGNTFSGTLPSEIGYLQQLISLDVQDNTFSGTVDAGWLLLQKRLRGKPF
eukprot:scaffold113_cov55-Cylindrotheca_fusiformis.AAC.1